MIISIQADSSHSFTVSWTILRPQRRKVDYIANESVLQLSLGDVQRSPKLYQSFYAPIFAEILPSPPGHMKGVLLWKKLVVGAKGFEPSNGRVKICCLWPLDYAPIFNWFLCKGIKIIYFSAKEYLVGRRFLSPPYNYIISLITPFVNTIPIYFYYLTNLAIWAFMPSRITQMTMFLYLPSKEYSEKALRTMTALTLISPYAQLLRLF